MNCTVMTKSQIIIANNYDVVLHNYIVEIHVPDLCVNQFRVKSQNSFKAVLINLDRTVIAHLYLVDGNEKPAEKQGSKIKIFHKRDYVYIPRQSVLLPGDTLIMFK